MEQEAQRVRETGSALERISEVAEHSARLVEGISRSSNDQVLATQELVPGDAADLRGLAPDPRWSIQARDLIRELSTVVSAAPGIAGWRDLPKH